MKNLLFFCGSADGRSDKYTAFAKRLGAVCAKNGYRIVYGGGDRGIMGALARAHLAAGGEVLGVLPEFMRGWVSELDGADYLYVPSMSDRKQVMLSKSDYALVLPGGIGTLDEFFEFATLVQLGQADIGLGIVNFDCFFSSLLAQLDFMVKEGFLNPYQEIFDVFSDEEAVFNFLNDFSI